MCTMSCKATFLVKNSKTETVVKALTFERKRKVRELPNLAVIIIKDLVLTIVLDHVLGDEFVIDDSRSDSLFVLLDLLLVFELRLNVWLHRRSIHHLAKRDSNKTNHHRIQQ